MPSTASRVVQLSACVITVGCALNAHALTATPSIANDAYDNVDLRTESLAHSPVNFAAVSNDREIMFHIYGGFAHQFSTNIDRGGEFRSSRLGASISAMSEITPDFDVRFQFGYEFDKYNFSGNTGLGGFNPWGDIHTFGFGVIFGAHMTNEWKIFAGPVFQFSAESGASFSDGFIGGGLIGTSIELSPDLTVGGGIGVVTQIERGTRIFPSVLINWQITDQLKLTTETRAGASGDTGIELVYDWGGGFETAVGGTYRFRRFRLDDGPLAPEGVGQHSSFPLWARLTYHFNHQVSINFHGGVVLGGELRLLDTNGNRIGREDYDPAGFLGVSGSVRF